jgi:hypothetical protein
MRYLVFTILFINILYANDVKSISEKFLGLPYKANTLIGSNSKDEKLVINKSEFDCFTFIDTIEALKSDEFEKTLVDIRYKNGKIAYKNRNHFFSDWVRYNSDIKDITCTLGKCKNTIKYLNQKKKNSVYLKGIDIVKRDISYIHLDDIDFSKLKEGDYIGIYTKLSGLDVTHVGLAIKKDGSWYLRHASSKKKKVIDSDLKKYIKEKLGILVYRSKR